MKSLIFESTRLRKISIIYKIPFAIVLILSIVSCNDNKSIDTEKVKVPDSVSNTVKTEPDTISKTFTTTGFTAPTLQKKDILSKVYDKIKFPWDKYNELYKGLKEKSFFAFLEYSDPSLTETYACYTFDNDYKKIAGPIFLTIDGLESKPITFNEGFVTATLILEKERIDADPRFKKFNYLSLRPILKPIAELDSRILTYGIYFDDLSDANIVYLNPCPPGHPPIKFK